MRNLVGLGIAALGTLFLVLSPNLIKPTQSETQTFSEPEAVPTESDSPRRLTVTVRVQEPEDLFSVNSEQLPVNSEGRNQN